MMWNRANKRIVLCLMAGLSVAASVPSLAQEIRFQDLTGRAMTLPQPASRIVSVIAPTASTVVSLDSAPRRLVGVNPISIATFSAGIVGRVFPEALSVPSAITQAGAGVFTPNVEAIARLSPDIVIQAGYAGQDIIQPLTNAGFNIALYMWGTEDQARQVNTMIATIIGRPDRAREVNQWRADTIARITASAAAVPAAGRAKVIQLLPTPNGFTVWGNNTMADFAISMAGAVNAAKAVNGMGNVNREQLAAWDPDVVFLFNSGNVSRDQILKDPILSVTSAGRSGRVYILPTASVNWGSVGEDDPLFWQFVAALTYPQVHRFDLVADMRKWFTFMYGRLVTEAEMGDLLLAARNSGAPNYSFIVAR